MLISDFQDRPCGMTTQSQYLLNTYISNVTNPDEVTQMSTEAIIYVLSDLWGRFEVLRMSISVKNSSETHSIHTSLIFSDSLSK
jgi:hypothetical protein